MVSATVRATANENMMAKSIMTNERRRMADVVNSND